MNEYVRKLTSLAKQIPAGIIPSWDPAKGKVRAPTQAFSDFLINRELGDWAESVVRDAINSVGLGLKAVRYGRSERLVAGEPGFKEYYDGYVNELRAYGKRPDLLVYGATGPAESEIEHRSVKQLIPVARSAIAGIEVRSSKQSLAGARTEKDLSFTPKIEDIPDVLRWVAQHGVKHYYVQVIFGAVYGISFERILEVLLTGPGKGRYSIDRRARNQFKYTIYVSLSHGVILSTKFDDPEMFAFKQLLSRGRVLIGVKFSGGGAALDGDGLRKLLAI